jgi:hypothetical protein
MDFASVDRHGPLRRTIHEFASAAAILAGSIQLCTPELINGPPARTMTIEMKRKPIDGLMGLRCPIGEKGRKRVC